MKYVFVTGGVVSSLGKGLAAAALGTLLEARDQKVILQKFDPYLNVDPGTMSPFQHGEVYVLDDGAETDLDLGHYERFTNCILTRYNNLTSGQVYETVLKKERRGDYLGKTVQVIPHVTDEIQNRIKHVAATQGGDVIITEIGGTVGDIEGQPFMEALRQFVQDVGRENAIFVHVTLVPYIKAAGELKSKPTQQSVAKLREIGIQPDIVICRTEHPLTDDIRDKISLYCNIPKPAVIEFTDAPNTIYEAPLMFRQQGFDNYVCDRLSIETEQPDMTQWRAYVARIIDPSFRIRIAVVGKYIELQDAYKSIYEALTHAGAACDTRVAIERVDSEAIEKYGAARYLEGMHGILIPGGFGDRGIEGKVLAAQYAREQGIPFFGICLGMQIAVVEYARNVADLAEANSTEFVATTPHPVVCLQEEQEGITDVGGTMRLGTCVSDIRPDTKAYELYKSATISERHRHRYEVNNGYREQLETAGLTIGAVSTDVDLVEMVEIADHPFYLACQFHPEFLSKLSAPHPLFTGFVSASLEHRNTLADAVTSSLEEA